MSRHLRIQSARAGSLQGLIRLREDARYVDHHRRLRGARGGRAGWRAVAVVRLMWRRRANRGRRRRFEIAGKRLELDLVDQRSGITQHRRHARPDLVGPVALRLLGVFSSGHREQPIDAAPDVVGHHRHAAADVSGSLGGVPLDRTLKRPHRRVVRVERDGGQRYRPTAARTRR